LMMTLETACNSVSSTGATDASEKQNEWLADSFSSSDASVRSTTHAPLGLPSENDTIKNTAIAQSKNGRAAVSGIERIHALA
jgi:hypothetical protein